MTRPRSIVDVPKVILGTARLGSVLPDALVSSKARETAFRALDGVLEAGCTTLDIAASYMVGGTERLIGHWMKARRNRDGLFLISKGGHPLPVVAPNRIDPQSLDDDLHDSLRRLQTDVIDLYLLHRDDPNARLEPIVRALVGWEKRGKIRAWGVSNWTHDRIAKLDALAREEGSRVAASSPHFSLAEWTTPPWKGCVSIAGEAHRDARAFHEKTQIPVLAYAPLGSGFFAGAGMSRETEKTYGSRANYEKRERLRALAVKRDLDDGTIALAYLFSQPFPTFAIVGTTNEAKMRKNLDAANVRLTEEELRGLELGTRD